ncbi:hypothetical protein ACNIRQ_26880, partial [Escherichia coli]
GGGVKKHQPGGVATQKPSKEHPEKEKLLILKKISCEGGGGGWWIGVVWPYCEWVVWGNVAVSA